METKKGIKFTAEQRAEYLKNGGQPRLDHDFTVFGEITKGLDKVMKISEVETKNELPLEPVIFSIKVKKKKTPTKYNKTSVSLGGTAIGF